MAAQKFSFRKDPLTEDEGHIIWLAEKSVLQTNLQHVNQILSARRSCQLSTLQESSETTSQFEHVTYTHVDDLPFLSIHSLGKGSISEVDCVVGEAGEDGIPTVELARKVIHLRGSRRRQMLATLHSEISVMKGLVHQHIVQITSTYETLTPPLQFGILMFPVGDENLSQVLEVIPSKGFPRKDIQKLEKWLLCLASALDYVHSQGIRHGDLKPRNIICKGSKIFLTDFGATYKFLNSGSTINGQHDNSTYTYSAPEVRFQGKRSRAADIFSLGSIYTEIATIITNRTTSDFHTHLNHKKFSASQPKIKSWFENSSWPEIYDLIRVMLSPDPENRPRAYEVVATFVASTTHPICQCVHGPILLPEYWDLCMQFELLPGLVEHQSPGSTFGLCIPRPEEILDVARREREREIEVRRRSSKVNYLDDGVWVGKQTSPDLLSEFLALMEDPGNRELQKRYDDAEAVSLLKGLELSKREHGSNGVHTSVSKIPPLLPPRRPRRDFSELQPLMVESTVGDTYPEFI